MNEPNSDHAELLETILADRHRALGARMVPFAGWNMPVQYPEGILAEHNWTRTNAGLFDICHMGEFRVTGEHAAEELDRALARPVCDQPSGVCRYNFLLNEQGGVLDDLIVYRISPTEFFLVVNASTRQNDAREIQSRLSGRTLFSDESDQTAKLDLQGPRSAEVLERFGFSAESLPGYYKFILAPFLGTDCLLSRTGYTGELGFELYCPLEKAGAFWDAILEQGGEIVKPIGLGARDTLRLEMGYPLYGHEFDPNTTPAEAGFGTMLKLREIPREFVGSAAIRDVPQKKSLVGLRFQGRRAARNGDPVLNENGIQVGIVTSGAFAPSLGYAVAMAFLDADVETAPGTPFSVQLARGSEPAVISALPFLHTGTARIRIEKS